jgi:hypothetical protein
MRSFVQFRSRQRNLTRTIIIADHFAQETQSIFIVLLDTLNQSELLKLEAEIQPCWLLVLSRKTNYNCHHICIEPQEQPWLESMGVEVIRKRVEMMDKSIFLELKENDILFIDSSHMIRTQGDVLFGFLEVLPTVRSGVLIHIHDIFTPRDYPSAWIQTHCLWSEQYLLEALLSETKSFEIIGALNYLSHHFSKEFSSKCPIFASQNDHEPGSFWIRKI